MDQARIWIIGIVKIFITFRFTCYPTLGYRHCGGRGQDQRGADRTGQAPHSKPGPACVKTPYIICPDVSCIVSVYRGGIRFSTAILDFMTGAPKSDSGDP